MIKKLLSWVSVTTLVTVFVATVSVAHAADTVVVTGDTSAGENQEGWLFNRDASTSTPFEFNTDEASIGSGSLYVLPIVNNYLVPTKEGNNKFIAEYFYLGSADDFESISYDFQIAGNGTAADANKFYLNVYTNLPGRDINNYYDCRFDFVPTVGSTSNFETFNIDGSSTPARVQPRGGATCPATLGDLATGSTIRAFAINVGDTSANDEELAGYLDDVVVTTLGHSTTFDFEADTDAPDVEITAPADGDEVSGSVDVRGTVEDDNLLRYYTVVRDSANGYVAGPGTVNTDDSFTNESLFTWDTTLVPDGEYTIRLEARDDFNQKDSGSTDVITVTVNNVPDLPESKDQCKKGGWESLVDSNNNPFKNQGQCVAFVSSGGKSIR